MNTDPENVGVELPDGSGVMVGSFKLPAHHWLYVGSKTPPMPMRMGAADHRRREFETMIYEAGKYAICAATANGTVKDFDPDALLQELVIGLLGYQTYDGLIKNPDDPKADPDPVPPLFSGR